MLSLLVILCYGELVWIIYKGSQDFGRRAKRMMFFMSGINFLFAMGLHSKGNLEISIGALFYGLVIYNSRILKDGSS